MARMVSRGGRCSSLERRVGRGMCRLRDGAVRVVSQYLTLKERKGSDGKNDINLLSGNLRIAHFVELGLLRMEAQTRH